MEIGKTLFSKGAIEFWSTLCEVEFELYDLDDAESKNYEYMKKGERAPVFCSRARMCAIQCTGVKMHQQSSVQFIVHCECAAGRGGRGPVWERAGGAHSHSRLTGVPPHQSVSKHETCLIPACKHSINAPPAPPRPT